jgi:hypothetical protein
MIEAVDEGLMRDLVADARRRNPQLPSSLTEKPGSSPSLARPGGMREVPPLSSPPGINYVDALCDAQDRLDRAERERRLKG